MSVDNIVDKGVDKMWITFYPQETAELSTGLSTEKAQVIHILCLRNNHSTILSYMEVLFWSYQLKSYRECSLLLRSPFTVFSLLLILGWGCFWFTGSHATW